MESCVIFIKPKDCIAEPAADFVIIASISYIPKVEK
jgi:hypothetical protein